MDITVKIIDCILILIIGGMVGLTSGYFWIGTQEGYDKLMEELPTAFIIRFASISLLGLAVVGILVLINYLLNKTLLKRSPSINLKKLSLFGVITVVTAALIGTALFVNH